MLSALETESNFSDYRSYTGSFLSTKRKKVHCYYWEPMKRPRGLLLISHGATDHTLMYEQLANEMAKRQFFVFGHDHVGHGRSEGRPVVVKKIQHFVRDTMTHIGMVKKKYPDIPLFLFGHSMGATINFKVVLERKFKVKGVVALAPVLLPSPATATPLRLALVKIFKTLCPMLPVARADVSLSCRDDIELAKMKSDPLRFHGHVYACTGCSLLRAGQEILDQKELVDFPYLLMHGEQDKVVDAKASKLLHASAPTKDKTLVIYPEAYHSLFQEPQDIFSDVLKRTIVWIEERS